MFSLIVDLVAVLLIFSLIVGFCGAYVAHCRGEEKAYRKWYKK